MRMKYDVAARMSSLNKRVWKWKICGEVKSCCGWGASWADGVRCTAALCIWTVVQEEDLDSVQALGLLCVSAHRPSVRDTHVTQAAVALRRGSGELTFVVSCWVTFRQNVPYEGRVGRNHFLNLDWNCAAATLLGVLYEVKKRRLYVEACPSVRHMMNFHEIWYRICLGKL